MTTTKELLDSYYDHIRAGNYDALFGLFADDVVAVVDGRSAVAGSYLGQAGLGEFYAKMGARMGVNFTNVTDPLIVDGDNAYAVENIEVDRVDDPGRLWQFQLGVRFTIADGKIARIEATPIDPEVYEAFYRPIEPPFVGKTFRFSYESGFVFDVHYDSADTMSFETVGDPMGGSLIGEKGTNPVTTVPLGAGRVWFMWQEDTPLQTTVTMLVDFGDSTMQGYLTYRIDDSTRGELFHRGTFVELPSRTRDRRDVSESAGLPSERKLDPHE